MENTTLIFQELPDSTFKPLNKAAAYWSLGAKALPQEAIKRMSQLLPTHLIYIASKDTRTQRHLAATPRNYTLHTPSIQLQFSAPDNRWILKTFKAELKAWHSQSFKSLRAALTHLLQS